MEQKNNSIILYSYWRSTSSWRVRLVLYLKKIPFEYRAINLLQGEQLKEDYIKVNPLKMIPTLIIDGYTLSESVAIMEYLEETRPEIPLLPKNPYLRAKIRQIVEIIAADIQPIQNQRVLKKVGEEKKTEWAKYWIEVGLEGLEKILETTSGRCCVGDDITLADCCLIPQVANAFRFGVDVKKFPIIYRINEELSKLEPFKQADANNQPDTPK